MRERLMLANLLDKLADLLKTSDEYKELSTDEADRNRREIQRVCDLIDAQMAQAFQIKTPVGEQRAILGVAK